MCSQRNICTVNYLSLLPHDVCVLEQFFKLFSIFIIFYVNMTYRAYYTVHVHIMQHLCYIKESKELSDIP